MAAKFRFDSPHLDSAQNLFFNRQLESIRPQLYEVEFPEFKGRSLVPVDNNHHNGSELITTRHVTKYAQVRPTSDYSTEAPRVDLLTDEGSIKVRGLMVAYGYSIQEIRAAQMAGMDLDRLKAMTAREAVERELDDIMFNGYTGAGITQYGLLNVSGPTTYTVPNGAAGSPLWANKTPDEIVKDMHAAVTKVVVDTLEIEVPDTMLLPLESYELIATTRMGDGSDKTILQHFLANSEHVKRVAKSHKCNTAGSGSTKRMVVYKNDPTRLQFVIPQEFEQFAPQQKGMEIVIPCHARVAGLDVHRPKSVCYADGI